MLALAAALMTFAAARLGIWVFPQWWVPYLLALLLVGVMVWRLIRAPKRPLGPHGVFGWLILMILVGIAGYAGVQSWGALRAARMPEGAFIALEWPLGPGTYLVANVGAKAAINAHASVLDQSIPAHVPYDGQGYAADFVAVDRWGFRANGVLPEAPGSYVIFGTPVVAPCAGRVVMAEGKPPDMKVPLVDAYHLVGNHIILRCGAIARSVSCRLHRSARASTCIWLAGANWPHRRFRSAPPDQ